MNDATITVVGHYGVSMLFKIKRFPSLGETIEATSAKIEPGGKGYNQAIGATRMGAKVNFITAVGNDDFGQKCALDLEQQNIFGKYVLSFPDEITACGVGIDSDQNQSKVVVYPGAIRQLGREDVLKFKKQIQSSKIVLVQNEISCDALEEVVDLAYQAGVRIVYNPAPARTVNKEIFKKVDCITPNETEAALLLGKDPDENLDVELALKLLREKGSKNVIITLGGKGAALMQSNGEITYFNASNAKVVSTTGAGDCFNAALCVKLSEGADYPSAVRFAIIASGIAVSREGANRCIPYRDEIEKIISKNQGE